MAKYAFIDVQNTDITTKKLLGFVIDWQKLYNFLKDSWNCNRVFLYIGVDEGDLDTTKILEELEKDGCIVRSKTVFAYKNKDKDLKVICPDCRKEFIEHIDMGYNRKSNCDVDLTVDAMEMAGANNEFYIFTGDGDFAYLIKKVSGKGTKVHIVSNGKKIRSGPRYYFSRFSTKLRKLVSDNPNLVDFINIDNIRFRIQKQ